MRFQVSGVRFQPGMETRPTSAGGINDVSFKDRRKIRRDGSDFEKRFSV